MAVVHAYYYTDPACPWSWALEPALRRLLWEAGESLELHYVMGGLAREFGDPLALVGEALEAGAASGMPVDPRLWLGGAPRSSHPACIAVKAVAEQGDPAAFLRRLREGFMCRRRKLDTADALMEEARAAGGVGIDRLRIDLASHAILEAFAADLERAAGRQLPSIEFAGRSIDGYVPFDELRDAALVAGARVERPEPPPIEQALRRFGAMSTAEVAAVCSLPGPRAPAELWRLAMEWRVRPERLGSGELWSLA